MSSTRPPFLVDYESDVNNWTTGEQSGGKPLMDKEQENKQASVLLVAFETNKLHPNSCITVLYAVSLSLSLPLINLRCWSEISLKSGNPNISCFISARTRERDARVPRVAFPVALYSPFFLRILLVSLCVRSSPLTLPFSSLWSDFQSQYGFILCAWHDLDCAPMCESRSIANWDNNNSYIKSARMRDKHQNASLDSAKRQWPLETACRGARNLCLL